MSATLEEHSIGNKEYAAGGQDTFQTSPDLKLDDVTGWTGLNGAHNVSIEVEQKNSEGVFKVQFPKAGTGSTQMIEINNLVLISYIS